MAINKNSDASRIALVTGAAGTVGSAVVRRLAGDGWKVAGVDLEPCEADLSLSRDVTERTTMIEAAGRVSDRFGTIDLLVTAAADLQRAPIGTMEPERWKRMLDVWLGGTANACAAVVPTMVKKGSGNVIVLSVNFSQSEPGYSYAAAASGTIFAFAKSFGCEVAPHNINVNCIAPRIPLNPDLVASTVNFLVNDGNYYVGQVFYPC
jgi:NAD(P)-dependent dehydrogenase (short-subunit alcohol dehydrogenase family)